MFRTLIRFFLWSAALMLGVNAVPRPATAEMPPEAYAPVTVRAKIRDRQNRPVAGLPVRLAVDLHGVALEDDGRSEGIQTTLTRTILTDSSGTALLKISGLPWTHEKNWYRGQVQFTATLIRDPKREISPLGADSVAQTLDIPEDAPPFSPELSIPKISVYEEPDRMVGGSPVWIDRTDRMDKVVVLLGRL